MADRLEAANALVRCHEGVLKSANAEIDTPADVAFRFVVMALIVGVDNIQESAEALKPNVFKDAAAVATSLRWTRDRICVPRDMSYPAARQLRAHLNWAADVIDPREGWQGTPLSSHDRKDTDPKLFGAAL
jgi:glutathione S-transferase